MTSTYLSNLLGYKIEVSNHFIERLMKRFGGKLIKPMVSAIKMATIKAYNNNYDEDYSVYGYSSYKGSQFKVVMVDNENGLVLQTIYST